MEVTLNVNFLAIENNDLELINGGSPNTAKVILLIGGAIIIGFLSPIAAASAGGLLTAGAVISATSALKTLIGGWCIGATVISAAF